MKPIIYFIIPIFFAIFIVVNGRGAEINFSPESGILLENDSRSDTNYIYNNSNISRIDFSMSVYVEIRFPELKDNFSVEGYLLHNNTVIDQETFSNPISPIKQKFITLGVVWFQLPTSTDMQHNEYLAQVWVNYSEDNRTISQFEEKAYYIDKTFTVVSFIYPKLITWNEHTIELHVLIFRDQTNFSIQALGNGYIPDKYQFDNITQGAYTFTFDVQLPINKTEFFNYFRYEIISTDSETNQNLHNIMSPYAVIQLNVHPEAYDNQQTQNKDIDDQDNLRYPLMFLTLIIILITFMVKRRLTLNK